MEQFLLIFESILGPIENTVDNLAMYFDPQMIPEPLIPWLASWVDLTLDSAWPVERRRELLQSAVELYRWRGTRWGLSRYLQVYTGSMPVISEYIPGMRLDDETKLGVDTKLGSSGSGHHFTVTLELGDESEIDYDKIRGIIETQKPAHAAYTLQVNKSGAGRE